MFLVERNFPLEPGVQSLDVENMQCIIAGSPPKEADVVTDGKSSAIFVVEKGIAGLMKTISDRHGNIFDPDHLRIFVSGREKVKIQNQAPMFWVQNGGKIDGSISILPLNNMGTWTLNLHETVAGRSHYDPVNGEMTALFGPRTTSPIINLQVEFFRSRVFEGLQQSEQDVVGGCLSILKGLGYGEKEVSDPLMMPAIWRIIHSVYLSRK